MFKQQPASRYSELPDSAKQHSKLLARALCSQHRPEHAAVYILTTALPIAAKQWYLCFSALVIQFRTAVIDTHTVMSGGPRRHRSCQPVLQPDGLFLPPVVSPCQGAEHRQAPHPCSQSIRCGRKGMHSAPAPPQAQINQWLHFKGAQWTP